LINDTFYIYIYYKYIYITRRHCRNVCYLLIVQTLHKNSPHKNQNKERKQKKGFDKNPKQNKEEKRETKIQKRRKDIRDKTRILKEKSVQPKFELTPHDGEAYLKYHMHP